MGRVGYFAAHERDRPVRLLDDDGSTGRDHATINCAAAMIDGSRFTKCVCAGGTAISGWLLCESRRCFVIVVDVSSPSSSCVFCSIAGGRLRVVSVREKGDRLNLNLR